MKIFFLTYEQIIFIHKDQIKKYGGSFGIRDKKLVKSAISQPKMTFNGKYLYENIFQMAAAYLFHIVNNHAFIDGNKRTGIVAALVFFEMNDIEIHLTNNELEKNVIKIASGKMNKNEISKWFSYKVKK
ncbi:MAG: type II toxin-antitoxin system death-on-curing family toxin [Parachlamydiales bacterium]|nr:type II toxin-antitoxin system death-on-curing family toxin [Parachlamydiales bacterium]